MANLFEQFHADFPGAQGFQDLPVQEKKKKKNIFEKISGKAADELSFGLAGEHEESGDQDTLIDYLLGVIKPMDRMKTTGSALLDILRQLGRPGSSVLTAAKRGGQAWKDPETWREGRVLTGPGGFPIPQRAIEEGVAGLKEGFTYEDETRGQDFLSESFRKNHPKTSFGLGFAIDWLTDPLTHGAHKLITGPIEAGVKGAGRQLSKSESLVNLAHRMSASTLANA